MPLFTRLFGELVPGYENYHLYLYYSLPFWGYVLLLKGAPHLLAVPSSPHRDHRFKRSATGDFGDNPVDNRGDRAVDRFLSPPNPQVYPQGYQQGLFKI